MKENKSSKFNLNWLHRPYPRESTMKHRVVVSLSVGLFVWLFLLFFQPFGLSDDISGKSQVLFGFGVITSVVMLTSFIVLPKLMRIQFESENWTVWKEILSILWNILLIAFLNYSYAHLKLGTSLDPGSMISFVFITLSVGVFPVTFLVFAQELFLTQKNQRQASVLSRQIRSDKEGFTQDHDAIVRLKGEAKDEWMEISLNELLFIQSVDNYCEVHTLGDGVNPQLLRASLKSLGTQTKDHPDLIRCHRSYMVNRRHIERVSGNARATYLHLSSSNKQIPLSRGFDREHLILH